MTIKFFDNGFCSLWMSWRDNKKLFSIEFFPECVNLIFFIIMCGCNQDIFPVYRKVIIFRKLMVVQRGAEF